MKVLSFDPDHRGATWAVVEVGARPHLLAWGWTRVEIAAFRALLREWAPDAVAVEHTDRPQPRRDWARRERKQHLERLAHTRLHATRLVDWARGRNLPVVSLPAWRPRMDPHAPFAEGSWRRALTGLYRPGDADVRRVVRSRVARLPRRAPDHLYDAVGLALVAAETLIPHDKTLVV